MKSRLYLGVLTTGLGAAALIGFSTAPAMADHIDNRPAVVREDPPPDPAHAGGMPNLQELIGKSQVLERVHKLLKMPAVVQLLKNPPPPHEIGDDLQALSADPKITEAIGELLNDPAVKGAFSGLQVPAPGQP